MILILMPVTHLTSISYCCCDLQDIFDHIDNPVTAAPLFTYTLGVNSIGGFFFLGSNNLFYNPISYVSTGSGFTVTAPDGMLHFWQVGASAVCYSEMI
jgi:hypothetical protein